LVEELRDDEKKEVVFLVLVNSSDTEFQALLLPEPFFMVNFKLYDTVRNGISTIP
jgi:hypothetical protein